MVNKKEPVIEEFEDDFESDEEPEEGLLDED